MRTLDVCADLYAYFHYELGDQSYYPPGAERISDNRPFGMFHASTPQHNKDVILSSLSKPDGVVRVVFATVALRMGINLQDINTVIHYGAPSSIEDYFQESGRGGRSGQQACSIVYWKPVDCRVRKKIQSARDQKVADVRKYLESVDFCHRQWLLHYFDPEKCCIRKRVMLLQVGQINPLCKPGSQVPRPFQRTREKRRSLVSNIT